MSAFRTLLDTFRNAAATEREKGTYFEELIVRYLRNEPIYQDLYTTVWTYGDWAAEQGLPKTDTGIDLVAQTAAGDVHAIQCKLYAEDYRLQKSDIDSFFTASGKKHFAHRVIVSTTNLWSVNAEAALQNQNPPVTKVDLSDLENSLIDWSKYTRQAAPVLKPKKALRPHQITAVERVVAGLGKSERGKLIMACGTGKTFTSLKLAEQMVGAGGRVLFLVPSLSLLSQTLTEWTQESSTPLHSFAVCSDGDVGKKRGEQDEDTVQTLVHELRYPATTDAVRLAKVAEARHDAQHMTVVFSTYHSIEVIHEAQKRGLADFDLIVCDEAHRTTGAVFDGADESAFVRVHDGAYIRAAKRLYMTATPRIYGDSAKATAERDNVALYSMDNEAWYGPSLHTITFSEAVKRGLLVDYKVIVLAIEEGHVNRRLQSLLADENNTLKVDDAAKIVGCWKALAKLGFDDGTSGKNEPMKRAVAFCQVIEATKGGKKHKISSKQIAGMFQDVVEAYQDAEDIEDGARLTCEADHVDGGMNASEKEAKLTWLKAEPPADTCRILSNVRCLSEGVDVPALDAVLFLTPRNSQVDVVQSVGRVMRNAPGKKRGYVVLPVVIPAGIEPHNALNDNKTYAVVWQVLQALRSHDDRFDAMVNKLELVGPDRTKMEVVAVADNLQRPATKLTSKEKNRNAAKKGYGIGEDHADYDAPAQNELQFEVGEIERALYAKVVEKCGNRHHWEDWANDIAKIAQTHVDRIKALLEDDSQISARQSFNDFAKELRDDLNDQVSDGEIIEMLAQHLITKPVFDALFAGYSFASHNPMSQAMQAVLDVLNEQRLDKEADTLQTFYDSVKLRAEGIDNAEGKQRIIVELYDKFFRNAFPRMSERLGIVYTPVEVVDFILHSVNDLLKQEFGQSLGSKGVHIIDPFTGTGTFITRLLQSGLIKPDELAHKYRHEIHANEIVLLAYYIAAINIEASYHALMDGRYVPFEGICLTDTFQMYEKEDLVDALLVDNSARRKRQKKLDIRVIVGNPPYSVGQKSENDNNDNVAYPSLDARIRSTYAARSRATLAKGLYDSYIRAIRWASDRIGNAGVIGFVTNAGWVEASTADGLRKCLADEFSSLYVFHLRGNARTSGEARRKEKDNVFGMGSRAPIAISLLVKNPQARQHGQIHFHDIGDYLSREEKLKKISSYARVGGVSDWQIITPDEHGDWLRQRDDSFGKFMMLGDKKGDASKLFDNFSLGIVTNRDAWAYNASKAKLSGNMSSMIGFYNAEVTRFEASHAGLPRKQRDDAVDGFINTDSTRISWTHNIKQDLVRGYRYAFEADSLVPSLYRPFTKQWLYYNRRFNERVYQMPRIFPDAEAENRVIQLSGVGARSVSALISNSIPCLDNIEKGQCFPEYLYEIEDAITAGTERNGTERNYTIWRPDDATTQSGDLSDTQWHEGLFGIDDGHPTGSASGWRCPMLSAVSLRRNGGASMSTADLFDTPRPATGQGKLVRRHAITEAGLQHFHAAYPGETITREDIFYYVYGLLHSPDYRERYADNLAKELPRIPCVKTAADFRAFSAAGRALGELHVNYDNVPMYAGAKVEHGNTPLTAADYRVEKMKYGKNGKDKDLTTIIYNRRITVSGIPLEAYDYIVNGKSAIDWVVERQGVREDKASGIVNDANDWATETMQNPRYPLELLLRVITVSLETLRIIASLPALDIHEAG